MEAKEKFTLDQVNRFVLEKQHLTEGSKINDIYQIAQDICGLHATHPMTPYLSLFIRTRKFKRGDLDEVLYEKRLLGKVRYARKTVYVIPKERISEVFSATKGMLEQRFGPYLEYLGMTAKGFEDASRSILEVLKGKGMTVKEIKKELQVDLNISAIVNLMCDQDLLVRGNPATGWRSSIHTYYPFHEYLPGIDLNEVDEVEAKKSMVKQYVASFGPVTVTDASWWTGFTKTEIKHILKNLKNDMTSFEISGIEGEYVLLASDKKRLESTSIPEKPLINFMPLLDPYLMGYKERKRYLAPELYTRVFDRSGNVTSTILMDGRIIGVWDFDEEKEPTVKILLFEKAESNVLKEINSQAKKIGKFISGEDVQIRQCRSMVPLTERTMGGFMSPLRGC
ncbi:MAG: AlkZ family DNA glycosylase [Thermoplasmata archaeon]|nr:MAG: AlkZ family DNA glycosylase [Thermoplasmata archaeon]